MTRIYLDSCSLQRPLDSKAQVRIAIEAEAILGVIAQVEEGRKVVGPVELVQELGI